MRASERAAVFGDARVRAEADGERPDHDKQHEKDDPGHESIIGIRLRLAQIDLRWSLIMDPDSWLGIELRHFLALEAVAREGCFGKAAHSLGYTQSAVSQQIAALERIVGQRLVERPG